MSAHGSGHQHCWRMSQWVRSNCKMSSFEYLHCNKSIHTVHHVIVLCTHAARTPLQEKVKLYSPVFKINSFSHSGFMSQIYIHIYAFYYLARCRSKPQMYINWIDTLWCWNGGDIVEQQWFLSVCSVHEGQCDINFVITGWTHGLCAGFNVVQLQFNKLWNTSRKQSKQNYYTPMVYAAVCVPVQSGL